MNPGNAEQNPPEKSMQQQAKEAADWAIAQIRSSYQARFVEIENIKDDGERIRARAQLAQEAKARLGEEIRKQATSDVESGQTDKQEDVKEKAKNAKRIFLEVKELNNQGIEVVDKKSQVLVDKIVEKIKNGEITDRGALDIERNIGKQLIEGVVFSKPGEQSSSFEEGLKNLLQVNPQAANPIIRNLIDNPETYGTTAENLIQKLRGSAMENDPQRQRTPKEMTEMEKEAARFGSDYGYYQSRFTNDQLDLISTFYSPEAFVGYMEQLSNETLDGENSPEAVQKEKQEIAEKIKNYYKKNKETLKEDLTEEKLKEEVDRHWGEKVSEEMNWRVSDVVNQLFLELQQKSPNKFYEEIMQEDIFQGPAMIQKRIQAAINSLMTKIDQIEKNENDPLAQRMKNLKLYRTSAKGGSYIEERGDKPDDKNKKLYPRLHPLPFGEKINLSEFVQYINTAIDQTIHKAAYFHNARAMYGHPAGEKGFYGQLGGYAESLKGTDIDEIMLLPDGKYVLQAFQLYEKMLEEDFASLDWRHRPDQFTNQLERVNSKLELEVFDQLKTFYPELTRERVRNIVNSAVGIARGVFLTEPEKSSYADPVDSEGQGMVASYSTNDAASLNVFNPLHTALRWQGEHNWNMMYFMPVAGEPGAWDHKKAWKNMAKYMDSFLVGKGRGEGKDKLPKELFADAMLDINNVGGPGKRRGWRMTYSLDGHYVFEKAKDAQGKEYSTNVLDPLKSFKAMEAIGYEAIFNFVDVRIPEVSGDLLKATKGHLADKRNEWFKYMYERYFDQKKPLSEYLNKLKGKGENKALEQRAKNGSNDNWEEQIQLETSRLFLNNFIAHYVAERMPSKFLRIDRNRYSENGVSRWEKVWREFKAKNWERARFDKVIKDMTMAEMLLRRQISEKIREEISFDKKLTLDMIDDLPYRLTEAKIRELLSKKNNGKDIFKSSEEINDVVELFNHIKLDFNNENFLDNEGAAKIKEYTFTFGLEDTDLSLIAYRGTGPRMIARAIKDTGLIESTVTPWLLNMPKIMNEIAINGKHDFSPIIEYLTKAQKAVFDVHGTGEAHKFVYKIAGTIINYFKKDGMAKPLFGLLRLGQRNSIAAEYAGRSSAVWEWDSRDIDRFCVALESYRLLPLNPYDLNKTERAKFVDGKWVEGKSPGGGQWEDRWIKLPFLKKPIKFGKKRHIDWEWNAAKLRKEHGADWKTITWDMVNQFLPIAMAFLLWKYIKEAMDEASGKKK